MPVCRRFVCAANSPTRRYPDTPFHLDGITQTIVSSLLLRCAEDGWISLDDRVGLYAPQSGKDTRRLIAKKSEQSKEVLIDSGKEVMDRGKELFDRGRELADEAADIFERGRKLVRG